MQYLYQSTPMLLREIFHEVTSLPRAHARRRSLNRTLTEHAHFLNT